MASVGLDCQPFYYQLSAEVGWPGGSWPTLSSFHVPIAAGERNISVALRRTGKFGDHDAVDSPDINDLPPTEMLVNTESQPALDLNGTQIATQGISYFPRLSVNIY
jgi:hypothetical protein